MTERPHRSLLCAVDVNQWTPDEREWQQCLDALGKSPGASEERTRIGRFRKPVRVNGETQWIEGRHNQDAKESLIGRLLLIAVARGLLQTSSDIPMYRTQFGRPYYERNWLLDTVESHGDEPEAILGCFNANVSHFGGWVVLAADTDAVVGVDIIKRECRGSSVRDYVTLMCKNTATPFEITQIHRWAFNEEGVEDDEALLDAFCVTWTLKESFIKAQGEGLSFELKRAEFTFDEKNAEKVPTKVSLKRPTRATVSVDGVPQTNSQFSFHTYSLDEQHIVSLCRATSSAVSKEVSATLPLQSKEGHNLEVWPSLTIIQNIHDLLNPAGITLYTTKQ